MKRCQHRNETNSISELLSFSPLLRSTCVEASHSAAQTQLLLLVADKKERKKLKLTLIFSLPSLCCRLLFSRPQIFYWRRWNDLKSENLLLSLSPHAIAIECDGENFYVYFYLHRIPWNLKKPYNNPIDIKVALLSHSSSLFNLKSLKVNSKEKCTYGGIDGLLCYVRRGVFQFHTIIKSSSVFHAVVELNEYETAYSMIGWLEC